MIRFENLSLTFRRNPKKSPLPWWEGMVGRGDQTKSVFLLSTPTLTLPHRRGRDFSENFKYL
jgi:hypothetical protein